MDPITSHVLTRWKTASKLGDIGVDSGTLLIIDPAYLRHWGTGEHPDLSDEGWHAALSQGRQQLNFASGVKAAVLIRGFGGDGLYPVTVQGEPSIQSITVDLSNQHLASKVAARYAKSMILQGAEGACR